MLHSAFGSRALWVLQLQHPAAPLEQNQEIEPNFLCSWGLGTSLYKGLGFRV